MESIDHCSSVPGCTNEIEMGATASWTCAPNQDGILPKAGAAVAWSESNAIVFANSVLGARTNRTGDLVDICCALTGRAPKTGLYLDENRQAVVHARVAGFPEKAYTDARFYPLVEGYGCGKVITTYQSISFWGGVDPASGRIIDPRHELFSQSITGSVLAFPCGKGSTGAPLVLLELVKQGTVPAAMINIETDPLLVAGPIISRHFYGKAFPVVALDRASFDRLQTGQIAAVDGIRGQIIIDSLKYHEK